MNYTATYSPDDNKIRLYASTRLPQEDYDRVKAAGFRWAPKQDLFFATWSPSAEDLAQELAGEIDDEDKSLTERAEDRAARFENYSDKRSAEADRAKAAVDRIADGIPFGQPILIGHHSERHARKDAARIENGMRKAVKLWETSEYWQRRAAGALAHAKYKELPTVRARRIKTIEADLRKQQRNKKEAETKLAAWSLENLTVEQARQLANHCWLNVYHNPDNNCNYTAYDVLKPDEDRYSACPAFTVAQVVEVAKRVYPRNIAWAERWIAHYENRLTYEKAMLEEQGASALIAKQPRPKQLPLVNYKSESGSFQVPSWYDRGRVDTIPQVEMTSDEYAKIYKDHKGTVTIDNSHRVRMAIVKHARVTVFLTDSKTHERPAPVAKQPAAPKALPTYTPRPEPSAKAQEFAALKAAAEKGVEVVSAPQLFVTPKELAQRVIEAAEIQPGHRILEPSAGTGALLSAIPGDTCRVAVEINQALAGARRLHQLADVRCCDFLQCNGDLGKFDRVVMNPPFADQADIDHVTHALHFLKPGGKLVAIMSAGVSFRQDRKATQFRETIERLGGTIEDLPDDSFKQSGTSVRTVLVEVSTPITSA